MTQDIATKRARLATEEDSAAACIARVNDYLSRTGLTHADFARRVGYGKSSFEHFLHGTYANVAGTAEHLVQRLNGFMDTHPIGTQIREMGELYETTNVQMIQQTFDRLLRRPAAYMIYAPPGNQKSFVIEHEVNRLNAGEIADTTGRRAFYIYPRKNIRPRDLVRLICVACGCRTSQDIDPMLANLRFEFRSNRVLLAFDEAQWLSIECFETIQGLLDRPPYFSLLFAGTYDLKEKFDHFSATLEHWNSRIIAKVRLPGLQRDEARGIIEREIGEQLARKAPREVERIVAALISGATTRDAFENNRSYISIRTLTNALEEVKAQAQPAAAAEEQSEVA